jgi:hypothetical protein
MTTGCDLGLVTCAFLILSSTSASVFTPPGQRKSVAAGRFGRRRRKYFLVACQMGLVILWPTAGGVDEQRGGEHLGLRR